jgi:hypothetical protein
LICKLTIAKGTPNSGLIEMLLNLFKSRSFLQETNVAKKTQNKAKILFILKMDN